MLNLIDSLLDPSGFLAHESLFSRAPSLLWTMIMSDALMAASYFLVLFTVVVFLRRQKSAIRSYVSWLLTAFIFFCGVTHVMDIWAIWVPDDDLQVLVKILTAVVSIATAITLWRLVPQILCMPSPSQLQLETQRREAAEAHVLESEQNLSLTLASIEAGFIATDDQGCVAHMNAVAQHLTGWTEVQAQGRSIWDVFARADRPQEWVVRNPVEIMIERGTTIDRVHHVVIVARDGTHRPVEAKAALTHHQNGSIRGISMVFTDASRIDRAEAEMRRLAAIVESCVDPIIGKTLDGRITSWNSAAQDVFGYRADEMIGQPISILVPPERHAEEANILERLAKGMRIPAFETVRCAKDGRLLELSVSISPIFDANGHIVGASKIARDLSHLRRTESALRESEGRLRFALESAQVGEWDLDIETGSITSSVRFNRCFGYADKDEVNWSLEKILSHVFDGDRDHVEQVWGSAVAALAEFHVECGVKWPDDTLHTLRLHASVPQPMTLPLRMLGIVMDVTQERQAQAARLKAQQLEAENCQILESNRLKNEFLANMSHELRTPLNAVIGFADLLGTGAVPSDSPKQREFVGHIASSGRHLLQLINDVLDLSKVESGKFQFSPEPIDFEGLVREVSNVLYVDLSRKNLTLEVYISPELGPLYLDSARLKQVLYNYLSNAIKFTPEKGRIILRAKSEGPMQFRVEVEDTGIGISAAGLSRLFVEFQQLESGYDKKYAGTGLGLALTRRLIEAQGGKVGVHSIPGQGSVFDFVLDRIYTVPAPVASLAGEPVISSDRIRLLIIDSALSDQNMMAQRLSDLGFEIDTVTSELEAINQVRDKIYDGIMLNLKSKNMLGLRVLDAIRDGVSNYETPVIGVTVPTLDGEGASFVVSNILEKPMNVDQVAAAMSRLSVPESRSLRVVVVDDDPLALQLMEATLISMGVRVYCYSGGRQALANLDLVLPDAMILDMMMPEFNGFSVLNELLTLPRWRHLPVFVWTSMLLTEEEYTVLCATANTIVSKGGGAFDTLAERLQSWFPVQSAALSEAEV